MTATNAKWFDSRPHRHSVCTRCRGSGTIHEPYALVPAERVRRAPKGAILGQVVGCSSIFEACREARDIAVLARRPVAFDFNCALVVVRPTDDYRAVARKWWKKAYGETPEETARRR